ncbi:hypothetical protein NHQ30_006720 [Ciborinia camelliae]|nr:hypothetical protein NHQ30_006720 [Ciborinia camelliae]
MPASRFVRSIVVAMGIDAGFDMVPRLSEGAVDKENFIEAIKEHYQNDNLTWSFAQQ